MPPMRVISAAVLLSAAALLSSSLAACGPAAQDADQDADQGVGRGTAAEGPDKDRLRKQSLDWKDCAAPSSLQGGGEAPRPLPDGTRWQCATMRAPLDWKKPAGESIGIELIRAGSSARASDRIGSLVFNFGGPGASGVATLPGLAPDYEKLRSRYDLVSFDPRGVGNSRGVRCLDAGAADGDGDDDGVDETPDDGDDEIDALVEYNRETAAACEKNSGDILPHVGTTEAAQDLDLMRHVLGDDKLRYFGISYGTELGGVYAHLFPRNVGRAVLDGVVDPTLNTMEEVLGQTGGFQLAFDHFAAWCVERGCTLGDSAAEIVETAVELEAELDDAPLPTSDGSELDGDTFTGAISSALYKQDYWPALLVGLEAAVDGKGDTMLDLAQQLGQRRSGGGDGGGHGGDGGGDGGADDDASNEDDAFRAITCADHSDRYTVADVEAKMPEFVERSPLFGPGMAWSALSCDGWPVPGEAEHPEVSAPGAPPILLVGNTGDPATPYEGAARMAERLGKGVGFELTYEGEGHGAYDSGNACVQSAVDAYLLGGQLPKSDAVCEAEPLPEGK
ncbi:alpha/beta hydrolase [Streptomyces sp. NBC_01012]|uniref:alpha/beta hydrolase n=1 Tax=Streptomyces sp. NBC_01012 TaxID=2903717 RepID=UPI0038650615|nr:alpha/beta hydrolase [Streptomyces sp. NBC_01012]